MADASVILGGENIAEANGTFGAAGNKRFSSNQKQLSDGSVCKDPAMPRAFQRFCLCRTLAQSHAGPAISVFVRKSHLLADPIKPVEKFLFDNIISHEE